MVTRVVLALVVGGFPAIQLRAAPGDLDMTFSTDGKVNITDSVPLPTRVRVQPDGKVVVAASTYFDGESYLARYNADGTPDETFGNAPFGWVGMVYFNDYGGSRILVRDFVILPDGRLLGVGHSKPQSGQPTFSVFRFSSNGTLDTTFGTNGRLAVGNISSYGERIVLQSDGKFIVAGLESSGFRTARYFPTGERDTAYIGGIMDGDIGVTAISEILMQPDGKIIVSGTSLDTGFIRRLNSDGTVESTFGVDTGLGFESLYLGTGLQTDGKILVSGRADSSTSAIKRYNSDLTPDLLFGKSGAVTIDDSRSTLTLAIQSNGKILTAGVRNFEFTLSRHNSTGEIDLTFGMNGTVVTRFFPDSRGGSALALCLQRDGKIIAAGAVKEQFNGSGMARYTGDPSKTLFDFDGDGRSELSVFRPSDQTWYLSRTSGGYDAVRFGLASDKLAPADYDGDGKTDIAIYRDGIWWRINSSSGTVGVFQFGLAGDIPQPADYNGDGRSEIAVYRRSNHTWYVYDLVSGQVTNYVFNIIGFSLDTPVVGDYNGDGRADFAIFVRTGSFNAYWDIAGVGQVVFGYDEDRSVPADYDGDGKTDIAVFRPLEANGSEGDWYIRRSSDGVVQVVKWGFAQDKPVPGDYDGDGKADLAIYRNGTWWIRQSTGGFSVQQFGLVNDKPLPCSFISISCYDPF